MVPPGNAEEPTKRQERSRSASRKPETTRVMMIGSEDPFMGYESASRSSTAASGLSRRREASSRPPPWTPKTREDTLAPLAGRKHDRNSTSKSASLSLSRSSSPPQVSRRHPENASESSERGSRQTSGRQSSGQGKKASEPKRRKQEKQ